MATSARINLYLLVVLNIFCSSVTWAGCSDEFTGAFMIFDWDEEIPTSATLSRYEKGSDYKKADEIYSSDYIGEKLVNPSGRTYLRIIFKDHRALSHRYDYRLIINNKVDFKIYGITPSKRRVSSCPLESAKVNSCSADAYFWIEFDKKCGKSLDN